MVAPPLHCTSRRDRNTGPIVGGDPIRRLFDGWLAKLIKLRDRTCRNPYCEAPIRHIDHVTRHTEGGRTTFDNGRGTCARCNYAREMPGWHVIIEVGLNGRPHTIHITTPTATTTSAALLIHHERGTRGSWEHVGLCASCSRQRPGPGTSVL
jgi:hypothetical protein